MTNDINDAMTNIAIFASGTGSNARKIVEYFKESTDIRVALIVSNKKEAGVLDIAREQGIPAQVIDRQVLYETTDLLTILRRHKIDFIVLAGFLWLIPEYLVKTFNRKIVNIHPALLPAYGGKGMYGMRVHEAVKAAGEKQTGITIHYVNEHYDEGDCVFQARCAVKPEDTPADIARKVQLLEHRYFPEVIAKIIRGIPADSTTSIFI